MRRSASRSRSVAKHPASDDDDDEGTAPEPVALNAVDADEHDHAPEPVALNAADDSLKPLRVNMSAYFSMLDDNAPIAPIAPIAHLERKYVNQCVDPEKPTIRSTTATTGWSSICFLLLRILFVVVVLLICIVSTSHYVQQYCVAIPLDTRMDTLVAERIQLVDNIKRLRDDQDTVGFALAAMSKRYTDQFSRLQRDFASRLEGAIITFEHDINEMPSPFTIVHEVIANLSTVTDSERIAMMHAVKQAVAAAASHAVPPPQPVATPAAIFNSTSAARID